MSESFEHRLSLKKYLKLYAHLAICKTCVYCFRQMKALRIVYRNYLQAVSQMPLPDDLSLSQEASGRIKNAIKERIS